MSEKKRPWSKWYWGDWRKDARLRRCSFAARGLWADILSLMGGECEAFGCLAMEGEPLAASDLAGLLGGSEREIAKLLDELERKRVFTRSGDDDMPEDVRDLLPATVKVGTIVSRRMVRDKAKEQRDTMRGHAGGNPDILRGAIPKDQRVRPYKRTDAPQKTRRIFDACGGLCHWCRRELSWSAEEGANFFHVDHLVPIRDGGTNDESNLVAACVACNHERARMEFPTQTSCSCRKIPTVMVGLSSDNKVTRASHMPEARKPPEPPLRPPEPARRVAGRFFELRRVLWPNEDDARIAALTIETEAAQYLADGATEETCMAVIERVMRQNAAARKSAPTSLRFCWKSMEDAIAKQPAPKVAWSPEDEATVWRARVQRWLDKGGWHWGPLPGEPGCEAPAGVLAEFTTEIAAKRGRAA